MEWRMPGLSWRVGGTVATVALVILLGPLAPHIVVADAGHHVVLGGARLPAVSAGGAQPDAITWFASAVDITNAGVLPIRVANPRVVSVDDDAQVSVRVQLPLTGEATRTGDARPVGAVVGRGGTAELWVTIGQPGCAPGGSSRVERGFRGIVVDVTTLGVTRAVTLDVDVAAYVETAAESLPECD